MTTPIAIEVDLATIRRCVDDEAVTSGLIDVLDCNGEVFASFPTEMTDEQIRHCLRITNRLFAAGLEKGKRIVRQEVISTLGLPCKIN